MLPIKLRVWDTITGRMDYHPNLTIEDGSLLVSADKIVMQSTGFVDKNGREIYFGDLLDDENRILEVSWGGNNIKGGLVLIEAESGWPELSAGYYLSKYCRVTGNIYER